MRNFILILGLISTISFTSCSSDDNNDNNNTESLLIGEWEYDYDPGYGDLTFYKDGRVQGHYFKEAWGDDFSEWGDWTLSNNNLKIYWDDSDPGIEIYDTTILELTQTKLKWKVNLDGEIFQETFTKK